MYKQYWVLHWIQKSDKSVFLINVLNSTELCDIVKQEPRPHLRIHHLIHFSGGPVSLVYAKCIASMCLLVDAGQQGKHSSKPVSAASNTGTTAKAPVTSSSQQELIDILEQVSSVDWSVLNLTLTLIHSVVKLTEF